MDWNELVLEFMLPAIGSIATVFAAGTAIWGICAWRREYLGKRRIDLSEEILALIYEARDVLEAVRSPLSRKGEGSTRKANPDETPKEKEMLDQAYIQIERCNTRQDLFAQLRSLRYRFMAQHGREAGKLFEELNAIRRELSRPINKLHLRIGALRRKKDTINNDAFDKELDKIWQEEWQMIYGYEGDNSYGEDPLLKRVDSIVQQFEEICRKTIN